MRPNPHKYHFLPERERIKCDPRLEGFWALGTDKVSEVQEGMARIWHSDTTLPIREKHTIEWPLYWFLTRKLEIDFDLCNKHPRLWQFICDIFIKKELGSLKQIADIIDCLGLICTDDSNTDYFLRRFGGYMQRDFLETDLFYAKGIQLRSVLFNEMRHWGATHPMRNVLLFIIFSRKIEILTGSGYHGGAPVAYQYPNGWGKDAISLTITEQQALVRETTRFLDYALPTLCDRLGLQTVLQLLEANEQGLLNFWLSRQAAAVATALEVAVQSDFDCYLPRINAHTPLKRLPLVMLGCFGTEDTDWKDVVHVCRGRSLRSLPSVQRPGQTHGTRISSRAAHIFGQMAGSRDYYRDLYTACCRAVWDNHDVANAVAWYVEEHIGGGYNDPIMKELMLFFKRNEAQLEGIRLGHLIDYLYLECARRPDFSLKGRTVHSMLRRMDAWHQDLWQLRQIEDAQQEWPNSVVQAYEERHNDITFVFKEITTSSALIEEGRVMRHCVASYLQGCVDGRYSIWSLSKNSLNNEPKRLLTIQLNREKTVVQACGPHNDAPEKRERQLLKNWAKIAGLRLDYERG
jgi:hypothetical protein